MSTERQKLPETQPLIVMSLADDQDKGVLLDPHTPGDEEREFDKFIDERLVGQPDAKACARRIFRRARNKLRHPRRPIYCYIAAGPSTTGKSMLPRLMAQFDHKDPEAVLVINGAEYTQKEHLASLIGAHSELVGYSKPNEMGAKSEFEKDPYCEFAPHNVYVFARRGSKVKRTYIVVEEWDQACPEFNDVLMSILREGFITLGNGVRVYFYECVLVLTTNRGMKEVEASRRRPGFSTNPNKPVTKAEIVEEVNKVIKDNTTKAFRNRVNEIIVYEPLDYDQMFEVVTREVNRLNRRCLSDPETMCTIKVEDPAKKFVLDKGLEGDGDLARVLQILETDVIDAIGGEMGKGTVNTGDVITVTLKEDKSDLAIFRKRPAGVMLNLPTPSDAAAAGTTSDTAARVPSETQVSGQTNLVGDHSAGKIQVPVVALLQNPGTPGLSGVVLDLSYLMFLQQASDLKQVASRDKRLMALYTITLSDSDSLDRLTVRCGEVVHDLINIMGLQVLRSQSSYEAPFTVRMKVRCIPDQVRLIGLRFPGAKVELDLEGDKKTDEAA